MHMSNYLKGVSAPQTSTTTVDVSLLEEANKKLREELDTLKKEYLELEEKFNNIPDPTPSVDTTSNDNNNDETIQKLQAEIKVLKKKLEISNEKSDNSEIKQMLEVIHDQLVNGRDYDHDDELTNDEVNEILEYIALLHDRYFDDIPLSEDLSRLFVWNISRDMYKAMRNSIDKYEPDVINPMFYMYIALSEDPAWMIGRFLDLVGVMIVDNSELIEEMSQEYQNQMNEEDIPLISTEVVDEGGMGNGNDQNV